MEAGSKVNWTIMILKKGAKGLVFTTARIAHKLQVYRYRIPVDNFLNQIESNRYSGSRYLRLKEAFPSNIILGPFGSHLQICVKSADSWFPLNHNKGRQK